MTDDDRAYYERRTREECEAAISAGSAEAAAVHRLLASEYSAMVRGSSDSLRCDDLILRALREDHLAVQADSDITRLAHEGMAAHLRQAAADLRSEQRNLF
jgi:hypothetical protein